MGFTHKYGSGHVLSQQYPAVFFTTCEASIFIICMFQMKNSMKSQVQTAHLIGRAESLSSWNPGFSQSQLPSVTSHLFQYLVPQSQVTCLKILLHNPPSTEISKVLHIVATQYRKETHAKSDFCIVWRWAQKTVNTTASLCFWVNSKKNWFSKSSFDLL